MRDYAVVVDANVINLTTFTICLLASSLKKLELLHGIFNCHELLYAFVQLANNLFLLDEESC